MEDRAAKFAEKIWTTKGARFNAYRRLQATHYISTTTMALLSVYVVFLQLGPALLPPGTISIDGGPLALLTAFLAIAILVLSLLEHSQSYQLRAERLHRSGQNLNELHDELKNRLVDRSDDDHRILVDIAARYHQCLKATPDNHDPADDAMFRAQHDKHFHISTAAAIAARVNYWRLIVGLPAFMIVVFAVGSYLWLF